MWIMRGSLSILWFPQRIDDLRPERVGTALEARERVFERRWVALDQIAIEVQTHPVAVDELGFRADPDRDDRVGVEERLVLRRLEDLEQLVLRSRLRRTAPSSWKTSAVVEAWPAVASASGSMVAIEMSLAPGTGRSE